MPRLTVRCPRTTATASSMQARSAGVQAGDVAFDAADELAYLADLLFRRGRRGPGPAVAAGGGEPFAGAEQVVEVGGQVGQVGDVGAEVVAAGAAEPERAVVAAGRDVGRLGAGAVGDSDRSDGVAGVLVVQERAGITPDAVPVPVELHGGDLIDGFAAAFLADAVVPPGDVEGPVVHELGEHVDGHAGVSVPLGVGVPVGIGDDAVLVVLGAVVQQQRRQRADPLAVRGRQRGDGQRAAAVTVRPSGGQQLQLADRGGGETGRGRAAAARGWTGRWPRGSAAGGRAGWP